VAVNARRRLEGTGMNVPVSHLISQAAAARILGIHGVTVLRLAWSGQLPVALNLRLGRRGRVLLYDERVVRELKQTMPRRTTAHGHRRQVGK
jgi:hypothetical protein